MSSCFKNKLLINKVYNTKYKKCLSSLSTSTGVNSSESFKTENFNQQESIIIQERAESNDSFYELYNLKNSLLKYNNDSSNSSIGGVVDKDVCNNLINFNEMNLDPIIEKSIRANLCNNE